MGSLWEYFEQHEEQAFIGKALLTIICIILVREFLGGFLIVLFILFPLVFLFYIRMQAAVDGVSPSALLAEHITFMPVMYAEKDELRKEVPWVTYSLILVNVMIFYLYEVGVGDFEFISNNLVFLPRDPNFLNVLLSSVTYMFLHGSNGHLWGNMTFLWVVGTAVERRVGWQRFSVLYLVTGMIAGFTYVGIEFLFRGEAGHILGASGAIAGIMGIFAVRCYFKSMVFPLPILGIFSLILPVSLKVRLNSLVIMGLFFLMDLSKGIGQLTGQVHSMVGHWAHLGGMISGMLVAGFMLKLGNEAVEERHLVDGMRAASAATGFGGGEKSLKIALEMNPDNPDAVLAMARIKTKFTATAEGRDLYEKAIRLLIGSRPQEAAAAFQEFYAKYLAGVSPDLLLRLSVIFVRSMDVEIADRCLEMVVRNQSAPADLREKATIQRALLLERMGHGDAAKGLYQMYLREFPQGDSAAKSRAKLGLPPEPAVTEHAVIREDAPAPPVVATAAKGAASPEIRICTHCGSRMVKRTATNKSHAGQLFWVCQQYPECKGVQPVEPVLVS